MPQNDDLDWDMTTARIIYLDFTMSLPPSEDFTYTRGTYSYSENVESAMRFASYASYVNLGYHKELHPSCPQARVFKRHAMLSCHGLRVISWTAPANASLLSMIECFSCAENDCLYPKLVILCRALRVRLALNCSLGLMSCYSSIGSRLKSARLSAPQTDHRFLSLLLLSPPPLASRLPLLLNSAVPSLSSVRSLAISSASSIAASSASGVSSMVSREEIEGDRDRNEVGVDGMLEAELNE